jgi:hypothetical protein
MELVNLANVEEETPDNCVEATEHESEELFEDACEEVEEGSSSSTCGFAACAPLAGLPDLVPEGESEFSLFAKFMKLKKFVLLVKCSNCREFCLCYSC